MCRTRKGRTWGQTQHVEPPPFPLIKETCNGKSDKDFVQLKCCRYPTSSTSDLYEFNIYILIHENQEEFLLFIHNLSLTFAVTGTLEMDANIQYLRTLVCGEALGQVYLFFPDIEYTETLNVNWYIKGLALYFSQWIFFQNKSVQCAAEWKAAHPKNMTLCGALDLSEWIFGFLTWGNL